MTSLEKQHPEELNGDPLKALEEARALNAQLRQELAENRKFMLKWTENISLWLVQNGDLNARMGNVEGLLEETRGSLGTLARTEDVERNSRALAGLQQREATQAIELRRQAEQAREDLAVAYEAQRDQLAAELQQRHAEMNGALAAMRAMQVEMMKSIDTAQGAWEVEFGDLSRRFEALSEAAQTRDAAHAEALEDLRGRIAIQKELMEGHARDMRGEILQAGEQALMRTRDELQANIHKVNARVTQVERAANQQQTALRERIATLDRDNGRAHAVFRQQFLNLWHDPAFHRLIRIGWLGNKLLGLLGLGRKLRNLPAPSADRPVAPPAAPAAVAKPAGPRPTPVPAKMPGGSAAAPNKPGMPDKGAIPALGQQAAAEGQVRETPEAFTRGFCSLTHVYQPALASAKQLRIVLDAARVFDPHLTGVGHYCEQLARALLRQPEADIVLYSSELLPEWILKQPGPLPFVHCPPQVRVGDLEQLHRAPLLEDLTGPYDVYLHTSAVFKPLLRGGRKLSVVYDLAPISVPETVPAAATQACKAYTQYLAATSEHFVADSEYTRREMIEHAGMDGAKIDVIPVGLDPLFRREITEVELARVRTRYGLDEPFLLCVGTLQPRKNLLRLIEAYAALDRRGRKLPRLVLTGSDQWSRITGFNDKLEDFQAEDKLQWLGYVDRNDMPALYRMCRLFVYPSYFEGYGMPVAEAMASGAAVACGNRTSLPEVGGAAAHYFDPLEREAIETALDELIDDDAALEELRAKSLEQAQSYLSWDEVARQFLRVIDRMRNHG